MSELNRVVLGEVNGRRLWFHARKIRSIWVLQLDQNEIVRTLEGIEHASPGDYICRGETGERWPQSEASLTANYLLTQERTVDGWLKCDPRQDSPGVLAADLARAFQIEARWGILSGNPGDYLIKRYEDRDVLYPDDVWIVARGIFQATYVRVD